MENEKENKKEGLKEKEDKKRPEPRTVFRELLDFFSLTGFIYGPLDRRLGIRKALEKALKKPIPPHVNFWFCLGGIAFTLFLIQVITGIMLLMYYRSTTAEAYKSVVYITNEVRFGWLIRGMHFWGANLMIVAVFLHMLRVFFYGAYKPPRDFNWSTGVILFTLTLGFAFTGYLLPWTQISYWATTVGTEIPAAIPLIGKYISLLIKGGEEISQITLTRFFAVHVVILPAFMLLFLVAHFLMVRKQGISGPL